MNTRGRIVKIEAIPTSLRSGKLIRYGWSASTSWSPKNSTASATRSGISSSGTPRLRGPNLSSSSTVVANSWWFGFWNT